MISPLQQTVTNAASRAIPVLGHTHRLFASADADDLSMEMLVKWIGLDPGLAVNVMRSANTGRQAHFTHRLTNIEYTVRMLGISRIRSICLDAPIAEQVISPTAKHHILRAYGRAVHAAMLAREFARTKRDMVPDEVYLAALLHTMGELVLWFSEPEEMRKAEALSKAFLAPTAECRYLIFGFTQQSLSCELAQRWNMPPLVTEAMKPGNATEQRVLGIQLAVQFSRYFERGMDRPDMSHCIEHVAEYLHDSIDSVKGIIDAVTHAWQAAMLPYGLPALRVSIFASGQNVDAVTSPTAFCIASQPTRLHDFFARFGRQYPQEGDTHDGGAMTLAPGLTLDGLLQEATTVMHDAIGLNRVVFALVVPDQDCLKARFISGADDDPIFDQFEVDLGRPHLISQIMRKPTILWINKTKWDHFGDQIPIPLSRANPAHAFFVQSVFVKGKRLGLFYADRRTSACQLDKLAFDRFQAVATLAQQAAAQILG